MDYTLGVVTILNQSIIDAGTAISVNLESNTLYSMQRKTMMGLNFTYDFSPGFSFGGSIMHLKEKPLTSKVAMGDEPLSNMLWGLNASWKKESQWLTNLLDKLPFVNATMPSNINLGVEFAHLIPGHADGFRWADSSSRDMPKDYSKMHRISTTLKVPKAASTCDNPHTGCWQAPLTIRTFFPRHPAAMISPTGKTAPCWHGITLTAYSPDATLR